MGRENRFLLTHACWGILLIMTQRGNFITAEISSGYKQLNVIEDLLKGTCWVAPVLANGRIYCRSGNGDLVCIDARK